MKHIVQDSTEETYCDHCDRPLLTGDRAVMSDDEKLVGCSDQCLRAAQFTLSPANRPVERFDNRVDVSGIY